MSDLIKKDSLLDQQMISTEKLNMRKQDTIKNLSERGANINLHQASKLGKEEIVEDLLENKVIKVNTVDRDGNTPLHLAAECNGVNPLHREAIIPFLNIVKRLMSHGATNIPNKERKTPSEIAFEKKYDCIHKYIETSNDPNYKPRAIAKKRAGTSAAGGYTYKHSVLTFLLVEGKRRNIPFLLGTKLPKAEGFSNAVYKQNCSMPKDQDASQILFFAIKFKGNPDSNKKITYKDLFSSNKRAFSIIKYFELYRKLKKRFDSDNLDPIFSKCHFKNCELIFLILVMIRTKC